MAARNSTSTAGAPEIYANGWRRNVKLIGKAVAIVLRAEKIKN